MPIAYVENGNVIREHADGKKEIIAKTRPKVAYKFSETDLFEFLDNSSIQSKTDFKLSNSIEIKNSIVSLKNNGLLETTYISAALSEFLRKKMILESNSSFSFESVFSHKSKLSEMELAKKNGYKIYLYFVATDDVFVNLERIQGRVAKGGHAVPEEIFSIFTKCPKNFPTEIPILPT